MLALHFSPFKYAFLFALGITAYLIRNSISNLNETFSDAAVVVSLMLIALHVAFSVGNPYFIAGISTALIISFASQKKFLVKSLFLNPW